MSSLYTPLNLLSSTRSSKKKSACLLMVLAILSTLNSCNLTKRSHLELERSILSQPYSVTTIEGQKYEFAEGTIIGDGQQFFSFQAYYQAINSINQHPTNK